MEAEAKAEILPETEQEAAEETEREAEAAAEETETADDAGKKKPRRKKTAKEKALIGFLVFCAAVFACGFAYTGYVLYEYLSVKQIEEKIGDMFDSAKKNFEDSTASPSFGGEDDGSQNPEESEWEKERRRLLELEARGKVIFAEILEINPDFLGMIEIPGVIPRQPYVMSYDNEEYLNIDFYGNSNRHGTVFLNSLNDRLMMDYNTVLFGHYTSTGNMFTRLLDYNQMATFARAPVILLDTLIGESTWIIFSAHVVEPELWYMIPCDSEDNFADFIEEIRARSLFDTDVDVTPDDRILTLSVCDYSYDDMRFVVHARKLREGEEPPEKVTAQINRNRKDYSVPNLHALSGINMKGVAFAQSPTNNRFFFFKPISGGLDRYNGDTQNAQGPTRIAWHSGISANHNIAAALIKNPYETDSGPRTAFIAVQEMDGVKGISLLSSQYYRGVFRLEKRVTPEDIDARYPAMQEINDVLWLYFSVDGEDGSHIYRQHLFGDNPELLHIAIGAGEVRPLGIYTVRDQSVLLWHDTESEAIYGVCLDQDVRESVRIKSCAADAKITLYGELADMTIKYALETNGKMTFDTINLSVVLSADVPQQTPEIPIPQPCPEHEEEPDPDCEICYPIIPDPDLCPEHGDSPDPDCDICNENAGDNLTPSEPPPSGGDGTPPGEPPPPGGDTPPPDDTPPPPDDTPPPPGGGTPPNGDSG